MVLEADINYYSQQRDQIHKYAAQLAEKIEKLNIEEFRDAWRVIKKSLDNPLSVLDYQRPSDGKTMLVLAIQKHAEDIIKELVEVIRVNTNQEWNDHGYVSFPLHEAIACNASNTIISLLIQYGANPFQFNQKETPGAANSPSPHSHKRDVDPLTLAMGNQVLLDHIFTKAICQFPFKLRTNSFVNEKHKFQGVLVPRYYYVPPKDDKQQAKQARGVVNEVGQSPSNERYHLIGFCGKGPMINADFVLSMTGCVIEREETDQQGLLQKVWIKFPNFKPRDEYDALRKVVWESTDPRTLLFINSQKGRSSLQPFVDALRTISSAQTTAQQPTDSSRQPLSTSSSQKSRGVGVGLGSSQGSGGIRSGWDITRGRGFGTNRAETCNTVHPDVGSEDGRVMESEEGFDRENRSISQLSTAITDPPIRQISEPPVRQIGEPPTRPTLLANTQQGPRAPATTSGGGSTAGSVPAGNPLPRQQDVPSWPCHSEVAQQHVHGGLDGQGQRGMLAVQQHGLARQLHPGLGSGLSEQQALALEYNQPGGQSSFAKPQFYQQVPQQAGHGPLGAAGIGLDGNRVGYGQGFQGQSMGSVSGSAIGSVSGSGRFGSGLVDVVDLVGTKQGLQQQGLQQQTMQQQGIQQQVVQQQSMHQQGIYQQGVGNPVPVSVPIPMANTTSAPNYGGCTIMPQLMKQYDTLGELLNKVGQDVAQASARDKIDPGQKKVRNQILAGWLGTLQSLSNQILLTELTPPQSVAGLNNDANHLSVDSMGFGAAPSAYNRSDMMSANSAFSSTSNTGPPHAHAPGSVSHSAHALNHMASNVGSGPYVNQNISSNASSNFSEIQYGDSVASAYSGGVMRNDAGYDCVNRGISNHGVAAITKVGQQPAVPQVDDSAKSWQQDLPNVKHGQTGDQHVSPGDVANNGQNQVAANTIQEQHNLTQQLTNTNVVDNQEGGVN